MAERYYWPGNPLSTAATVSDGIAELTGDEANHLVRVMRRKPGDTVTLFDGNGREFPATITESRKDRVTLNVLEVRHVDTEAQRQVTLAVALPKGDRQKWLIEKLTELGCFRLIPLQTERSVAQCSGQVLDRLRRQVIEAAKQCGRTRLMQISPEQTIADISGDTSCETAGWMAHPRVSTDGCQWDIKRLMQTSLPKRVLFLIGPEGGFTDRELELAVKHDVKPLDLGVRLLRVETAAMIVAALCCQ